MTTTLAPPQTRTQLWNTMPGWGLIANLLPPEVITKRRLAVLRKMIVLGLLVVMFLGVGGYAYAWWQVRGVERSLSAEQDRTTSLMQQQSKYSEVVQINGTIAEIKGQLSTLLGSDVDLTKLIDSVLTLQPHGGDLTQLQVALIQPGAVSEPAGADVLDTSGQVHIGDVTLTGEAGSMSDIAHFVTALSALPGIVSVYPASQQVSGKTAQYTIELTLTDLLYSHRFAPPAVPAVPTPGGN